MKKSVISVNNIGKEYQIGTREPYKALRDILMQPFRRSREQSSAINEKIWALKDVSFEVNRGDVIGIIGRNGAGKTTLLKILSRVTTPTLGRAEIRGQVAALLEVGTGFHPELTGRENIYLSGAILGMKKAEIKRKFDEIVAFAEVGKFIDTPVKRYSSGMFMRLAFAVPAHLEADILLIDEVLAVGDLNFQKKCLNQMEKASHEGRTVIFVSHNIPSVLRLCRRVLLLDKGKLIADGNTHDVVKTYLESSAGTTAQRVWNNIENALGDETAKLKSIKVADNNGNISETMDIRHSINVEVEYWKLNANARPNVILCFYNEEGTCLFTTTEAVNDEWKKLPSEIGLIKSICKIPDNFFAEGLVSVSVLLASWNPNVLHCIEKESVTFQVIDKSEGDGVRGDYANEWGGVLRPMLDWATQQK